MLTSVTSARIVAPELSKTAYNCSQHRLATISRRLRDHAKLYLFQKHSLCRECIVYHSLMLRRVIKPLRQTMKEERRHT